MNAGARMKCPNCVGIMTTRLINDIEHKPCDTLREQKIRYASSKKAIVFCTERCPHDLCVVADVESDDDDNFIGTTLITY